MAILIISIEQEWAQDHHQVPQIGFRLGCLGDMSVRLDTPFWWVQLVLGFFFFISIFFFYLFIFFPPSLFFPFSPLCFFLICCFMASYGYDLTT